MNDISEIIKDFETAADMRTYDSLIGFLIHSCWFILDLTLFTEKASYIREIF
jgi:hypothetical protein